MADRFHFLLSVLIIALCVSSALASDNDEPSNELPSDLIDMGALESEAEVFRNLVMSVTATMTEKRTIDTASNITVLAREDIEALRPRDAMDLFRAIPGLDTARYSDRYMAVAPTGLNYVRVNQYLVMVDGIPFPTDRAGGADWPSLPIPIDQIEKVEYLAGPKTALYGPNAALGVINIITRIANPKLWGDKPSTASVQGGTQGFSKVAVAVNEKREKIAYTAWATRRGSNGFEVPTYPQGVPMAGERNGDRSHDLSLGFTANRELKKGENLRFGLNVFNSDYQTFISDPASNTNWNTDRTTIVSNIVFKKELKKNQHLTLMLNHQNRDDDLSEVPYAGLGRTEDFEEFTHTQFEARHTTQRDDGKTITLGASYNKISGEGFEYEDSHSFNDLSFYGLADLPINDKNNVFLGMNTYSNSDTDSDFTFTTGLLHKLGKNEVIRLGYATGIRAPDLKTLYFNRLSVQMGPINVPVFEGGNTNLENEEFSQLDLGYERRWRKSSLKLDLFMGDNSDRITVENVNPNPGPPLFGFRNRDEKQSIDGGLLTYEREFNKKVKSTFAYRYADVDWDDGNSGRYAPRHRLMLNMNLRPTKDWTINMLVNSNSPFYTATDNAAGVKLDSYQTVDLTVQLHCGADKQNTAWLKVTNLFDSNHYELFRETGAPGGAEMERLVTFGYKMKF